MSPLALLTRASLDIRGVRPSMDEFRSIEADPGAVDGLIEDFLYDTRFPGRLRDLFDDIYLTRRDGWSISPHHYDPPSEAGFNESVGDEPLQILSAVADADLPWTEIVRADWTMVDENLAAAWPTDYPEGEAGWQQVHYTDARPSAGVLTTNSMWWRFITTDTNVNRARANAITRLLLCYDFLLNPVTFDRNVSLIDEEAVRTALSTNPSCVNCHSSMDPIASYLGGFYFDAKLAPFEQVTYHPEREEVWRWLTGVPPGFFGEPGVSLDDLGRQIAGDPRFAECAVEQAFEILVGRPPELSDFDELVRHREAFITGGLTLRALLRSVLASDTWRASPESTDPLVAAEKMVSPALMASQVEDITGFRLRSEEYDLLLAPTIGLRTLAGGIDGETATVAASEASATIVLVQERLAQAASQYAVAHDAERPEGERLFDGVDFSADPTADPDAAARLHALRQRVLGLPADTDEAEAEVQALLDHLSAAWSLTGDAEASWGSVLTLLLRDPDFLFY